LKNSEKHGIKKCYCLSFLGGEKRTIAGGSAMDTHEIQMPHHHQVVMNRFGTACQADERVVAAFLGGSYATGTTDAYSDLDLFLITTDEAYEEFSASREAFIRLLGEQVFLEDFNGYDFGLVFFIFRDDTEGELALARESHFTHIHGGPHRVLFDKKGILTGAVFSWHNPAQAEQIETLRQNVYWFWHKRLCAKVVSIRSERGLIGYAPFFLSALTKRSQATLHTAS
jgi:hypothetical protein